MRYGEEDLRDYGKLGPGLKTRDIASRSGHGGYSRKLNKRMSSTKNKSSVAAFTLRTAQILDVARNEVPDLMTAPSQKAVRVNELQFDDDQDLTEQKNVVETEFSDFDIKELPWFDGAYLFDAMHTPDVQSHDLTQTGKTFIQNPSSFLPVIALEPRGGQTILDMCAAPGGKTALIAAMTKGIDEREIYANEPKARRAQRMSEVLGTLGVNDVVSLAHDGKHLPSILGQGRFDRVLVDAECSTDSGINFASSDPLKDWSLDRVKRMNTLQRQLIASAYDLLQPGGILVYSTCTLSPEENEDVIKSLLERRKGAVVQPILFESEDTVSKIKKWDGIKYPEVVSKGVLRVRPTEHMDSFCLSRLRKPTGDESVDRALSEPVIIEEILSEQRG